MVAINDSIFDELPVSILIRLCLDDSPESIVIEDFGTLRSFEKNCLHASLAAPSTGGDVILSLSSPSWTPQSSFFADLG